jgi:hypothetical protein
MTGWRVLVLLFLLLPGMASAQDAAVRRDSAVAKLTTGQQIRISGAAMSRLVGRAGVASTDSLDFAQDDAVRRIPIPAIDTLWVRGGHAKTGAIIGGALLGGLATAVYASLASDSDSGSDGVTTTGTVGSFLFGATVGVVIGGFIGGSVPAWRQRFP